MSKKAQIKSMTLETEHNTVDLSIDEAKELYRQLHELFGQRVTIMPERPVYVERWPLKYWQQYDVWCGTNSLTVTGNHIKATYCIRTCRPSSP